MHNWTPFYQKLNRTKENFTISILKMYLNANLCLLFITTSQMKKRNMMKQLNHMIIKLLKSAMNFMKAKMKRYVIPRKPRTLQKSLKSSKLVLRRKKVPAFYFCF